MSAQHSTEQKAINATYLSIFGNTALALAKWLVGFLGNSYALIADAIESTADIFASILVLIGLKYANRPPDKNHPYGHGRIEPLVTFIVVGFLIASATIIAYKSIQNINTPHETPKLYTLIFIGVIIVIKEIFYRILLKKSKETHSSSLKADAWHHRSDAITSLTAFIGILIAVIFGKGYESADDWAALVAAFIILYNGYLLLRPALGELMDEQVYDELVLIIRNESKKVTGVVDTEKCYIRKAGLKYYVDLHVLVNANLTVKEGHAISHNLKDALLKEIPQIANVLIHIEPAN